MKPNQKRSKKRSEEISDERNDDLQVDVFSEDENLNEWSALTPGSACAITCAVLLNGS